MNVTLHEPGDLVRTIDAERRYIHTFMVTDNGELTRYDDGLHEASRHSTSRLDSKVADQ